MNDTMFEAMRDDFELDDLSDADRDFLNDFRAAEAGPIAPPTMDLDVLRARLVVVRGARVTMPSGDVRDAADLIGLDGQETGLNDWVATELGAEEKRSAIATNALGCARLWVDEPPWDDVAVLFTEAAKSDDKDVKSAAANNQGVLYTARVAAKKAS